MQLAFEILASIFVLISVYEYYEGIVIDIAFTSVLARNQHSKVRLLVILLVKLLVWLCASAVLFFVLELATINMATASLRQAFLILFVLLIAPLAFVRKWYAKWVARMSHAHVDSR